MKPEKKPARPKNSPKKSAAPAREKKPASKAAGRKAPAKTERPKSKPAAGGKPKPGARTRPAKQAAEIAPAKAAAKPAPAQPAKPAAKSSPKPAEKSSAAPAKAARPKKPLKVPPILLEGDAPPKPKASGPGARYALAPEAPGPRGASEGELPESYGTGQLFLAARDPHWLYASWDLAAENQKKHNAESRDGHLVLRVYAENETEPVIPDVHVHPESRNWFIHVPRAETRYSGVLGYYSQAGEWHALSRSRATLTPPDAPSDDTTAEFASIPRHISFQALQQAVQDFVSEKLPLVQSLLKSAPEPLTQTQAERESRKPWPMGKAKEIAKLVTIDNLRRVWMGSLEITELIRRRLGEDVSSEAAAELAKGGVPAAGVSSISSPAGGEAGKARGFWFNVNAELIIYGATERDARVTIAGRPVNLRPDGSFSFRFSLPDGAYELPAAAVSADGEDARSVTLRFSRSSDYSGQVEAHPQDPALKPPKGENI